MVLNAVGIYHLDQVANWTADEVAWIDENLDGFKGRVPAVTTGSGRPDSW